MGQSVSDDGEYCEKHASAGEPARKIALVLRGRNAVNLGGLRRAAGIDGQHGSSESAPHNRD